MRLNLGQRLCLLFAALLLACCSLSAGLQVRASHRHEQEVVQGLSRSLAQHIAEHTALISPAGLNQAAVHELFNMLMVVNPSVEVYLLDAEGRIAAFVAPQGHVRLNRVDLRPVQRFLAGDPLPILGDDPRDPGADVPQQRQGKVFSAAPLVSGGRTAGYVYVVLLGEAHDALAADVWSAAVLRTALWSMALVTVLGLAAGWVAFALITQRLRKLTASVRRLETDGVAAIEALADLEGPPPDGNGQAGRMQHERDEITLLCLAFQQMARRLAEQWRELVKQDQQRRELVANISHDLRTPLTSLHGYLETLSVKSASLNDADRRRYLDTALAQSRKVGRLAQELFELARLEYGAVKPEKERFSLPDLVQDVFQKFELAAQSRGLQLSANFAPDLPAVSADLGMIERVLTNLLDNAIRHTPSGGQIQVELRHEAGAGLGKGSKIAVQVADSGPGIPRELRGSLFSRPSVMSRASEAGACAGSPGAAPMPGRTGSRSEGAGGLGLLIVQRILRLHDSDICLLDRPGQGAVFAFGLRTGE